jgi:transposase
VTKLYSNHCQTLDLNPIEKVFALIKHQMKNYEYHIDTLRSIVESTINKLTANDMLYR